MALQDVAAQQINRNVEGRCLEENECRELGLSLMVQLESLQQVVFMLRGQTAEIWG